MSPRNKDDGEELEEILEEEPEEGDEGEEVGEEIEEHDPPESVIEMGYDEFQQRVSAFWDSLGTPLIAPAAEPKPKTKPAPEPKPRTKPVKKVSKPDDTKKEVGTKKFRVRLFRKF